MLVLLFIIEFLCGAMMFSYWLGLLANKDIRAVGDGNPGAFNLIKSTGIKLGLAGVFLDFIKGYFPLVLFIQGGYVKGMEIVPVAIAPVLGHAFSPFLGFKGGKAIAVSFGIWSAATKFKVSIAYAVILALMQLIVKAVKRGKPVSTEVDAFMVVTGMAVLPVYLLASDSPGYLVYLWLANFLIMSYKNKDKLYRLYKARFGKQVENEDSSSLGMSG